jgi:hypothetical protein
MSCFLSSSCDITTFCFTNVEVLVSLDLFMNVNKSMSYNKLCDVHLGFVVLLLFDFHGYVTLTYDKFRLQFTIDDDEEENYVTHGFLQ